MTLYNIQHTHTHTVCMYRLLYYVYNYYNNIIIIICWPLLSNQSLFRQIAGYVMGVDDHRVGW